MPIVDHKLRLPQRTVSVTIGSFVDTNPKKDRLVIRAKDIPYDMLLEDYINKVIHPEHTHVMVREQWSPGLRLKDTRIINVQVDRQDIRLKY